MKRKMTENKPPHNDDLLENISRFAQQAYALRCAFRAMPAIGCYGNFSFWKDDTEKYVTAIEDMFYIVVNDSMGHVDDKNAVTITGIVYEALKTTNKAKCTDGRSSFYPAQKAATWLIESLLHADNAVCNSISPEIQSISENGCAACQSAAKASSAIKAAISAVAFDACTDDENNYESIFIEAANEDFQKLLKDGCVDEEFFNRPLWPGEQPKYWNSVLEKWKTALEGCSLPETAARYNEILKGQMPWEHIVSVSK